MPLTLPFAPGLIEKDDLLWNVLQRLAQDAIGRTGVESFVANSFAMWRSDGNLGRQPIPLPPQLGGSGTSTVFTQGSVIFVGASGVYAQDNPNFFWDDANNRLGLGTSSPQQTLDVNGRIAVANSGSALSAGAQILTRANNDTNWGLSNTQAAGAGLDEYHVRIHGGGAGTRQKRQFQVIDAGAANTVRMGVNFDGTGAYAKFQDYGGAVFNVMAAPFGAIGDGITDDTAAINAAITAATGASRGSIVLFPSGFKFKTTGAHSIGVSGLHISGYGAVISLEHATNDLFVIATGANRDDISFEGFMVDSSTVRTAGWVINWSPAYNSGQVLRRCRIRDVTMLHQFNGIWEGTYEYNWLDNVLFDFPSSTGGVGAIAFKIGQTAATNVVQGSEIYLTNCQANNRSGTVNCLSQGFWFEDCDAVYLKGCGSIASVNNFVVTNTGHGCANHFWQQVTSDGTCANGGHSTLIQGALANVRFTIVNSWFASAGRGTPGGAADGMHINAGKAFNWTITNCEFYNNSQYGLYVKDFIGHVSGNTFDGNVTKDFFVDATAVGNLAGQYNDNYALSTGWQTAATAARTGFNGNFYLTAPVYGVAPAQNVNNVTY